MFCRPEYRVWLAILGPLQVHDGQTHVDVPKGRLRVLLSALLLHAGSPVAAGDLTELVWDGSPPPSAAVTLRSHVLRLRRVLGPRAGARLVTRHPGYLFQAGEDEVDVLRFRSLCRDGNAALREGAWADAYALLAEALGLWRGAALADVPSDLLHREEVPGMEEPRLQAEEWRTDAALRLGRHDELVAELQAYDRLRQALAIHREAASQDGAARALGNLGITCFLQARYQQATSHLQQALAICHQNGDRSSDAETLNSLGEIFLPPDDPAMPEPSMPRHLT